jgi:phosphoglucomutase
MLKNDCFLGDGIMQFLRSQLPELPGKVLHGKKVVAADDFEYKDPVDHSISSKQGSCPLCFVLFCVLSCVIQGIRVMFEDESRIVFRLSGTGTEGATVRIYLEQFCKSDFDVPAQEALATLISIAEQLSETKKRSGRKAPDVIS